MVGQTAEAFLELHYGKLLKLDLHGMILEEAKAELFNTLFHIDIKYKGILVVHGYHKGTVLKNYIRKEFAHKNVYKKVHVDASQTILLLDMEK